MNWQPIETAPTDGKRVLLYCPEPPGSIDVGHWSHYCYVTDPRHGAWIIYENRSDTIELQPTHWMPLPESPTPVSVAMSDTPSIRRWVYDMEALYPVWVLRAVSYYTAAVVGGTFGEARPGDTVCMDVASGRYWVEKMEAAK